jgi:hypothetical protein
LLVDVGVVDLSLEGDDWTFEWEVIKLKLDFKLATLEWCCLWTCHKDAPDSLAFFIDYIAPKLFDDLLFLQFRNLFVESWQHVRYVNIKDLLRGYSLIRINTNLTLQYQ